MAERAQKEPTMEEILSSIRKIIADGDRPGAGLSEPANEVGLSESVEGGAFDYDETHPDVFPDLKSATVPAEDENPPASDFMVFSDLPDLEDDIGQPQIAEVPVSSLETEFDELVEAPQVEERPHLDTSDLYSEPLADVRTVETAAGYLANLLSEINFDPKAGGEHTIDALVRELLRPMMKEWLDTHLPGIVEQQVGAEVRRIARMVR